MLKYFIPLAFAFLISNIAYAQDVEVNFPDLSGTCGSTIDIPVTVNNFNNLFSAQFSVEWDTDVLQYNSEMIVGLPQIFNFGYAMLSDGRLGFSWFDGNGSGETLMDGDTLFTINFTVLGGASGTPLTFVNSPTTIEFGGIGGIPVDHELNPGTFTVIDTFSPTFTQCPGSQTVTAPNGASSATVNFLTAIASDNCTVNTLDYVATGATTGTGTDVSGTNFNAGVTTVTYTATDFAGNVNNTCTFDITVNTNGATPLTLTATNESAGCPGTPFTLDILADNFTNINVLSFSVNWDQSVLQYFNTNSLSSQLPNATFGTSSTGSGILTFSWVDNMGNGETMPNGSVLFSIDFNPISTFNTTPVTITSNTLGIFAEDTNGNQVAVNTNFGTVSGSDTVNPVITGCPNDQTVNASAGTCMGSATWTPPTATDNCALASITSSHNPGMNFPFGNTTVTYTARDASNNSSLCTFIITVADNENPVVTCPANVNMTVPAGTTNTVVNGLAPINPSDNCGVSSTSFTLIGANNSAGSNDASGNSFNLGTTTLTYTVMDNSGNSGTCSSTVTISTSTSPTIDTLTVIANPMVACDDTNVTIGIGLDNVDNLTSVQFSINWDPTVLQFNGATNLFLPNVFGFGTSQTSAGTLTYTWDDINNMPVNLPDGTSIITIDFTRLGSLGTNSFINITGNPVPLDAETTASVTIPINGSNNPFLIDDFAAPIIEDCPSSMTLNNDPGNCSAVAIWDEPEATDNCYSNVDITRTTTNSPGEAFPIGTTTVVYTFTDPSGNTSQCNFDVTVVEDENPTVTCPADVSMVVPVGSGSTMVNAIGVVSSNDNCAITSTSFLVTGATSISGNVDASGIPFNVGTSIVTYTVNDASGNSGSCSFNVTIMEDMTPPPPAEDTLGVYINPLTVECDDPNVSIDIGLFNVDELTSLQFTVEWDPTVFQYNNATSLIFPPTTNFGVSQTSNGSLTFSWFGSGAAVNYPDSTLIINLDLSLLAGSGVNSSIDINGSVTQIEAGTMGGVPIPVNVFGTGFSVMDSGAPTFTFCPNDIQVNSTMTTCDGAATWMAPTATDNCDNNVAITGSHNSGDIFPVGLTVVTYTGTDDTGNMATCTFDVEVLDNGNPVISNCPADITQSTDAGLCSGVVTWTVPTLSDNCPASAATLGASHLPGSTFPVGSTIVTYTAVDGNNNNALPCNFTITINDDTPPTIVCPQDTMMTILFGMSSAVINNIAPVSFNDNCINIMETYTLSGVTTGSGNNDASGTTFNVGNTVVTYTTVDNDGNDASCIFNVTILEENPGGVLTVIAENDTIDCSDQMVTIDFTIEEFTNVGSVQFSVNWDTNVLQYVANTPMTLTPVTGVGVSQVSNGIITFSWFDSDGSTETFPDGSVIFSVDFNVVGNLNSNSIIFINDNTTPVEGGTFGGTPIPVLTLDGSFVVSDLTPPEVTGCPTDILVSTDSGFCGANVTWPLPMVTDVCSNFTTTSTHNPGDLFPVGITPVTYTYEDDFGNTATCMFNVTVTDDEMPSFTNCPSNITEANDSGICAAAVFWPTIILSDNCGGSTTTSSHSPGFIFPVGTTTVTYTATDPATTNTSVCTFDVTVMDDEGPNIICPSDTTIIVPFGMTTVVVNDIAPVSSNDNCGTVSVTYDLDGVTLGTGTMDASGVSYNEGTTTVTYEGQDPDGNSENCDFDVIVIEQNPGNTLTVIAENDTINCDAQNVTIDFRVENFTDIGSLQYSVNWDQTVLQYNTNTLSTLPPSTGVGTSQINNGILTFSWFDSDGSTETFPDGSIIFSIDFTIIGPNNSSSIISINDNTTNVEASTFNGIQVPVFTSDGSFVLTDLTGPFVNNCPADINISNDPGSCDAVVNFVAPSASDECSMVTTTSSHVPGDVFPVGMTTVTYEFSDQFGNTEVCTFNVTVADNEAPIINNCPNDITVNTDPNACDAVVNWTSATATDNCGTVSFNCSSDPGDTFLLGTTFVSCTASDDLGNVTLCSFQVTVIDNQDPTISCPDDLTVNINNGVGSAVVNGISPNNVSDNCTASTVTYVMDGATSSFGNTDASGESFNVGVTTVTYSLNDATGNTISCSFDVEVIELFPPGTPTFTIEDNTIDCGANTVILDISVTDFTNITDFQYSIEWDPTLLTFNGFLNNTLPPTSTFGTTQISNGILTHTWMSSNINGEIIPDGDIYSISFNVIGTFNSTDVMFTGSGTPIAASGPGNVPVTINTVDGTINFNDSGAPVFTNCPGDITAPTLEGTCQTNVSWVEPSVSDDCSIINLMQSHNPGDIFPVGTTTVNYTATDGFGNSSVCTFNVTVTDDQVPQIICPGDVNAESDPNNELCGNFVTWSPVMVSDNCGSASIADVTNTHNSGDFFPVGTTMVTFTATDTDGMPSSCSFTVNVIDDTTPAIACPDNIEQMADPGMNGAVVNWNPAFATDNCDFELSCSSNPGEFFAPGTTVVMCNVADASGNANMCSFTVTVTDCDEPVFSNCPADITLNNDTGICGAVVTWPEIVLNENCSSGGLNCTHDSGDFFPAGTTQVSCTALDVSGNTVACVFNVTIIDTETPVFTSCPGNIIRTATDCSTNVTWAEPVAEDNCMGALEVVASHTPGSSFSIGMTTVSYSVSDGANNTDECSFIITVEDTTAPVFGTCPADVTLTATGADCSAVYTWPEPIVTDNCTLSSVVNSHEPGSTFPVGSTTVSYDATDAFGNTASCVFVVTVTADGGTANPTLSCPTIVRDADNGACSALVNWSSVINGGDCTTSDFTLDCTHESGVDYPVGTTAVSCTLQDANGATIDDCTFNVIVNDISNPAITGCPNNIVADTDEGDCSATVTWLEPNADDACGIASFESNANPGDVFQLGTTLVTYVATDVNGGTETCTFNVTIENGGMSSLSILASPSDSICFGTNVTLLPQLEIATVDSFIWVGPNGFISDQETPMIADFQAENEGVYSLTVNFQTGCSGTSTITLAGIDEAPIAFTVAVSPRDSLICAFPEESLTFTTSLDSSQWTNLFWITPSGDSVTTAELQLIGVANSDSGVYTAVAETVTGCVATASQAVFVSVIPNGPTVTGLPENNIVCLGDSFTLSASSDQALGPDDHFNWASDQGEDCAGLAIQRDEPSIVITPQCVGTYIYWSSVEIDNCLSELTEIVVNVLGTPTPADDTYVAEFETTLFGFDVTLNDELAIPSSLFEITINSNVSNGTLVNNGDGTFDYTPDEGHIGQDQFVYQICYDVCGENVCEFAIVTITTTFDNGCPIYTVITPNGDGLNDELFITCVEGGQFPDNQLVIFNEWGDEVYKAEPYTNDWFGTYNDEPLPDGTYFYLFRLDENSEHTRGYFTILR